MSKVIIFGIGRGADVAFRYISKDSPHEVCGFTVDKKYITSKEFNGLPVVEFENIQTIFPPDEYMMFTPMGFHNMNKLRYQKYIEGKEKGYDFISYVSSKIMTMDDNLQVGENCFILEGQTINFDVKIGNNVTIWSGNQIGDCSVIMDNCWLSSHVCISGNVTVKPFCVIGINSAISNFVTVEEETYIGANVLLTKNTEPKSVYVVESTKKSPFPSDRFVTLIKQ
jgi:sugar O-acyltransferase (sialic acid O-acetyltransferase NeuD family)